MKTLPKKPTQMFPKIMKQRTSIDVRHMKNWETKSILKNSYGNDKFHVHLHYSELAPEFCHFCVDFYTISLPPNFCYNVYLRMNNGCASFYVHETEKSHNHHIYMNI
jgi:hypothetical protein